MGFTIDVRIGSGAGKPWPEDCAWPEPLYNGCGPEWEADDLDLIALDEEGEEFRDIKDYYDGLVEKGVLNESYELIRDDDDFFPDMGEEYWIDEGFDIQAFEDDLTDHMNHLKIDITPEHEDPPSVVREMIGYEFVNENLLRQAFTRRAFAVEHALSGCGEQLEFIGDSILGAAVTRNMTEQLSDTDYDDTEAPFSCDQDEGDLTKIRSGYVSKDYLSKRASQLGFDELILYGTGEKHTDSALEDAAEALIGAVAVDSDWDERAIRSVVDRLTAVQLYDVKSLLKKSYYDTFNAWHQSHFGRIPEYVMSGRGPYHCAMKYMVPENDKGIWTDQRIDVERETRSAARELAAELAYDFVVDHGLWKNISDAGITPDRENSINQLQEIWQKGYLDEKPVYEFQERLDGWKCICRYKNIITTGDDTSKTAAKKTASYKMLTRLLR